MCEGMPQFYQASIQSETAAFRPVAGETRQNLQLHQPSAISH